MHTMMPLSLTPIFLTRNDLQPLYNVGQNCIFHDLSSKSCILARIKNLANKCKILYKQQPFALDLEYNRVTKDDVDWVYINLRLL